MADKQSLIVRLKFHKHDIAADGKLTRKSRIVVLKPKSPSPIASSEVSSSESDAPPSRKRRATEQQGRKSKRTKFEELADIDETAENGDSDALPQVDTTDEDQSRLTSLCRADKTDDELMLLPAHQIRGVNLLQLRLTRNITTLINDYNVLHEDHLQQTAIKKAFSSAFNHIAEVNAVPVDDLKTAYNSISTASKARKSGGKIEVVSEPTDLPRRSSRAPPRLRDATPAVKPATSKKVASKKSKPKKEPKPEIIGAPEEPSYPAYEKFDGEVEVEECFAELVANGSVAKGSDLPRLPFYHSLYKILNKTQDFDNVTTEQLREIDHLRRLHTADEITQAVNAMTPGCTTWEEVSALLGKVRVNMVLPGAEDNSYDEETDSFLPKDELLNRRAPKRAHGYNGRMWN